MGRCRARCCMVRYRARCYTIDDVRGDIGLDVVRGGAVHPRGVGVVPAVPQRADKMQIFSFCSYLHSCSPPIVHGNLTCDTIFIQHNGLVKIGSGNVTPHTNPFSPPKLVSFGREKT